MISDVYKILCKKYEQSTRDLMMEYSKHKYVKDVQCPEKVKTYKYNLNRLREFLDHHGMTMPKPKWRYNNQDETTWLYTYRQNLKSKYVRLHRYSK